MDSSLTRVLKTPPKISVLLATYNGGRFLQEQLDSLAAQTYLPSELVVCDDGSADATFTILEAFAAKASFPVRIIKNQERLGYRENFLNGVSYVTHEAIAFCDQDDVWLPKKLELCAQALAEENVVLVLHSAEVVDESLEQKGFKKPDIRTNAVKRAASGELTFTAPGFAMVFRTRLLRDAKALPRPRDPMAADSPLFAHDQWVAFLAEVTGDVAYLSETLALYRQHGKNTCGASSTGESAMTLARQTGSKDYEQRGDAARYYAEFLASSISLAPAAWAARFTTAAERYDDLAGIYLMRAQLHSPDQSYLNRLRALSALVRGRAYQKSLGWKAMVKDLVSTFFPVRS